MRGNQSVCYWRVFQLGSIPARAGEPLLRPLPALPGRVYPRTCGGTGNWRMAVGDQPGLSPHVRGNRRAVGRGCHPQGSIPARAGEPLAAAVAAGLDWVYPRTCGGTGVVGQHDANRGGLSPHVRGNLDGQSTDRRRSGSIPARAGEPQNECWTYGRQGVYPRTCGGTCPCESPMARARGLSPHVRGNHFRCAAREEPPGSIPARAGEPISRTRWRTRWGVYPRTCGGTSSMPAAPRAPWGLSPHVRGNPCRLHDGLGLGGSIPARAGEPHPAPGAPRYTRVYPRTCGGTGYGAIKRAFALGLSPHVRGNRYPQGVRRRRPGSIPARAGEPQRPSANGNGAGVYPRTCGGTASPPCASGWPGGLSPHVRGNPWPRTRPTTPSGSIPARAGEPIAASPAPAWITVYPRTCGGTIVSDRDG